MEAILVLFKANGQWKDFPLVNATTVIGRGESCDLRIPLLSISRRHCELVMSGEVLKVKDLASSNGTFINNKRVNEARLKAGDRLVVGPIIFTVQIDGEPEEVYPTKTRAQMLAEQGEAEEIVDLEAGIVSQPGASGVEEVAAAAEDFDPITALEALAGEHERKKKEQGK